MRIYRLKGLRLDPKPYPKSKESPEGYQLATVEKWCVTRALYKCNGSVKAACQLLDISERRLNTLIDKHGMRIVKKT